MIKNKTGIELIAEERKRQVEVEGWSKGHDDGHDEGELAYAGAAYALPDSLLVRTSLGDLKFKRADIWPFNNSFKPTPRNRIKELVKAGALIAAEIDRLQNK